MGALTFSPMLLRRTPPSVLAALGQSRQQPAQRNPQLLTSACARHSLRCPSHHPLPPLRCPHPTSPLRCPTPSSPPRCPSPHHLGVLTDSVFPKTAHMNQNLAACWGGLGAIPYLSVTGWKRDYKPGRAPAKSCFRHCIHMAPKAESGSEVRLPGWEAVVLRLS